MVEVITVLVYYGIAWIGLYLVLSRLKTESKGLISTPIYLMLKTIRFNKLLERIGKSRPLFWRTLFNIGIAVGFGQIAFGILILTRNIPLLFRDLAEGTTTGAPTRLIIPLPEIGVPLEIFPYVLISIGVLLITHEAAHGIASAIDDVPIKSSGAFLAVLLPGGFVEVDEEHLAKREAATKLRVFAAGSFVNVLGAVIVILLMIASFAAAPEGALVKSLVTDGPAEDAGVQTWSVITSIDNVPINSVADFDSYMRNITPNATVNVEVDGQTIPINTNPSPANESRAIIGVFLRDYVPSRLPIPNEWAFHTFQTAIWMQTILLGVALVNMLPIFPFDGDRFFDTLLRVVRVQNTRRFRIGMSSVCLGILFLNVFLSSLISGSPFLT